MDSIDITDSAFSLEIPDINNASNSDILGWSGFNLGFLKQDYIFIGIAILIGLICIFAYQYYKNKKNKKSVSFHDCPGGFCTMDENPNPAVISTNKVI